MKQTRTPTNERAHRPVLILAIDPGPDDSGYAVVESTDCRPTEKGKVSNDQLRAMVRAGHFADVDKVVVEMVDSYGIPVGRTTFDTVVWIGRFLELLHDKDPQLVYRTQVKMHFIGRPTSVTDSLIRTALVDRFARGHRNYGKGTKGEPGWFYGFHRDVWQAYAVAVREADLVHGRVGLLEAVA